MGNLIILGGHKTSISDNIGKEAYQLHQMINQGFNVPPSACIPSSCFVNHLENSNLITQLERAMDTRLSEDLDRIRSKITEAKFTIDLMGEIDKFIYQFPFGTTFVVRSSGVLQNLQNSSEGQVVSFPGLRTTKDVVEAVKNCWASIWGNDFFSSGQINTLNPRLITIDVVIQVQINSTVSGVLFTLNPLSGKEDEMMIESIFGFAKGVAPQEIIPDRYIVNWNSRKVLKLQISSKQYKVGLDPKIGTKMIKLPEDLRDSSTLNTPLINQIIRLGLEVGKFYGTPQQLEWGIEDGTLYLLQTGPISQYQFDHNMEYWARTIFFEGLSGNHNILAISLIGETFTRTLQEFFIETGIWNKPPSKEERPYWHSIMFGKAYWNVSQIKGLLLRIPEFREELFNNAVGFRNNHERIGRTSNLPSNRFISGILTTIRLRAKYRSITKQVPDHIDAYFAAEKRLSKMTKNVAGLTNIDLRTYILDLFDRYLDTNYLNHYVSLLAILSLHKFFNILNKFNSKFSDAKKINPTNLFTGQNNLKTVKPLLGLYEIAGEIYSNNDIKAMILNIQNTEFAEILKDRGRIEEVNGAIREYIDKFFWLTGKIQDLSSDRLIEDPRVVVIVLKRLLKSGHIPTDTELIQSEVRDQEETHAQLILSEGLGKFKLIRNQSFWKRLKEIRNLITLREEIIHISARLAYYLRQGLLELANRWIKKGIISRSSDIFRLKHSQIMDYFETRDSQIIKTAIHNHQETFQMYENFHPPKIIGGGISVSTEVVREKWEYQGMPCSSGIVKGRARVLISLDDVEKIESGEIIIVPAIPLGWSPLFAIIRGIIVEDGSFLSHGAVVARECGIPTILQIDHATSLIKTGDIVELDGTTGKVRIIE